MADVDLSTRVVMRATNLLRGVRERVNTMVPYGPMQMKLTPREALDRIESMTADERLAMVETVGVDEFLRTVMELRAKVGER